MSWTDQAEKGTGNKCIAYCKTLYYNKDRQVYIGSPERTGGFSGAQYVY